MLDSERERLDVEQDTIPRELSLASGSCLQEGKGQFLIKLLRSHLDFLVAVLVVLAVDILLFHLGTYYAVLQPESYSGRVCSTERRFSLLNTARSPETKFVVIMGNSTAGAGVQEEVVNRVLKQGKEHLQVVNLAEGGSSPKAWYFLLRGNDVKYRNTELAVLGIFLPSLVKETGWSTGQDRAITKTELRVTDLALFAGMFRSFEDHLRAGVATAFRTPLFRKDIRALLADPVERLRLVKQERHWEDQNLGSWTRENRSTRNLVSARLKTDGSLDKDGLDDFFSKDEVLKQRVERALRRESKGVDVPALKIYEENFYALELTIKLLEKRGVRVVLAVIPSAPIWKRFRDISQIKNMAARINRSGSEVYVFFQPKLLDRLENPLCFRDYLHMNKLGADIYSRQLSQFLLHRVLSQPHKDLGEKLEIEAEGTEND